MAIKGNGNNVYLNAVCLQEMRKDSTLKIAVPREEDQGEAVNILRLRSLSDYTALPVLHVAPTNLESAMTKKTRLQSHQISYQISFERAEYGKEKKKHSKPFPRDWQAIHPS